MEFDNKLGIEDADELAKEEERIAKIRAIQLFDSKELDNVETGCFTCLSVIHRFLFDEIYDFAGTIRTSNNSADTIMYTPVMFIGSAVKTITEAPQDTFDDIMLKFTEMTLTHPFFKGNGRAMRIWINALLKQQLSKVVDWSQLDADAFNEALRNSPEGDAPLKALMEGALTDAVDDRDLFLAGLDASFAFSGFSAYKSAELEVPDQDELEALEQDAAEG